MKPIFITIGELKELMVIPDTEAHLDGHEVITYSYNIYVNQSGSTQNVSRKENKLHLEKKDDPDYRGVILFKKPGRLYEYVADADRQLDMFEVQELVEKLNHYRENPSLWSAQ